MRRANYWAAVGAVGLFIGLAVSVLPAVTALAATDEPGNFSLQITPTPIIVTAKPGESRTIDLAIRNNGTKTEKLKVSLRKFLVSEEGTVQLTKDVPKEVEPWVHFADPAFTVEPAAVFVEKITFNIPKNASFSYAFSVLIQRAAAPVPIGGKPALQGSVVDFTLVIVDRPGAIRKYEITEFSSQKNLYEYLPAIFTVKLKNTGNTLVQPTGNIYIQRSSNSSKPITVLPLNPTGSYVLSGTSRTFVTQWQDGFPVFVPAQSAANADKTQQLQWRWANADSFRFGHYVAKLVAVYNDGKRDVPIESEVSFWVIPWKLLIGMFVILAILVVGIITIVRKTARVIRHKKPGSKHEGPKA